MFRLCLSRTLWGFTTLLLTMSFALAERPRLAVLTDIGGDPDDQQSLVRLLIYANEFEIEALIASAAGIPGQLQESITRPDLIRASIEAYGRVRPNLQRHAQDWPTARELAAVVKAGNPHRGREYVGQGHDTEASRLLIERVDAGTSARPLNISVWGGQTDLAQALWHVKHTRTSAEWNAFTEKLRVYDIADQDALADWIRAEYPGLCYILSHTVSGQDRRMGTYRGMYLTGDESLTSREWIQRHVLGAGPLGELYPTQTWTDPNPHGCLKEGDTPAWFFFLPQGGNDPSDPTRPGWGGQYRREPDGWYRDLRPGDGIDPRLTVSRWRPEFQADFARRLAWCRPETTQTTR